MENKNQVKLTNLEKIFWPEENYTKKDFIEYYEKISPFILPYLKDRPLSLKRFPNGIEGESFFQKDLGHQAPAWVKTKKIFSPSTQRYTNYVLCQNKATLLYLANLAGIEMHIENSRLGSLLKPDYLVLDLDPEELDFSYVVDTARTAHKILEKLNLPNFCKTSGVAGLHVFVPLGAKYSYDQAEKLAHLLALAVNKQLPELTSLERNPQKRRRKIYLDYLQNARGKTVVAPYSLRPKSGAPVSAPLSWREVNSGLDPKKFNIESILRRLEEKGDLWKGIWEGKVDMKKSLEKLGRILK